MSMTKNAFLFAWDTYGIESIIPITQYEFLDKNNLLSMLADKPVEKNPLPAIIRNLILRAQVNSHRFYEVYAIDCDEEFTEEFWKEQWNEHPQATAELIRERGYKLFSAIRTSAQKTKIV